MASLLFKKGLYKNLPSAKSEGTVYITTDERAMYLDVSSTERIRIQGTVLYFNNLTEFANNVAPPYSTDLIYFIADKDALMRWNGTKWIQLNATADTVQGAIDTLTDAIQTNADDIDALETLTTNQGNAITSLEGRMDTAESDIDAVEGRATALETRMGTAETDIDNVENRATALEGRMDTAEDDIEALETLTGTQGGKITALETRMGTAESDIDAVEGRATALEGRMTTAESDIDAVEGRATSLEGRMDTAEDDIDALETSVSNLDKKLTDNYVLKTDFNSTVNTINNSINDINAAIGSDATANTIKGRIKSLEDRATNVEGRVDTAEDDIDALEGSVSDINTAIGTDTTAGSIKGRIKSLETRTTTAESDIDALEGRAGSLETRMTTAEGDIDSLEGRMSTAEDDIEAIEANIRDNIATKAELNTAKTELSDKIDDEIRAVNAMTYKNGVDGTTSTLPTTNVKVGDTYIVTKAFGDYQPGDLLVASGTEGDNGYISGTISWNHVETGYSQELEPELSVTGNTIALTSYSNQDLGTVTLQSNNANLVISTSGSVVTFDMQWGSF